MKFPLSWLREHLDTTATLDDITTTLSAIGIEVEGVEDRAAALAHFRIARVIEATPHPNADRLRALRVDVGYDSDPAQVHALLRQVARDDPRVMSEPAPTSVFVTMGANALNFELRVFVDMNDRMGVNTDLNARILATLKHHGIEIPFPQMDVHVRDVPAAPASVEPADKQSGAQTG